jgi:hypothetical protein
LQLGLGVWSGSYNGFASAWLRWYDAAENWLPTAAERAEAADQRAAQEAQQAEQATQRAAQETQRAEQLAARLRALGIDPDQLEE